jgi:hypothetical protein
VFSYGRGVSLYSGLHHNSDPSGQGTIYFLSCAIIKKKTLYLISYNTQGTYDVVRKEKGRQGYETLGCRGNSRG